MLERTRRLHLILHVHLSGKNDLYIHAGQKTMSQYNNSLDQTDSVESREVNDIVLSMAMTLKAGHATFQMPRVQCVYNG